jgi:alpha-mannosidase
MKKSAQAILVLLACLVFCGVASAQQPKEDRPAQLKAHDFTAELIGHAHIDLAWLWRWEETIHDIATHTFLGTLAQMEKMPGLTFAQSQAAIYEAMEQNYPDLFRRIKDKVKEGTWIPVGGMWVEPDLNMPDGESLARQLLYGKRYFLDKFGVDVTVGWNPDSFGHNLQLPQILAKAGITSYVFERCAPENTPVFWWEGADGSRVLAYVPPGWYLVNLKDGIEKLLLDAAKNTPLKDFMLLYGAGDHGGGPRDSDVEAIARLKKEKNQPRLEFVTPENYFRKLESSKIDFPVVKRELNFTFPACYTTQAEIKKNNRRSENLLLSAEKFSALAVFAGCRDYYPEKDLDEAWKIVLRNQFHDILDGSSIGPVYEEAKKYYEAAWARGQRALDFSLETITDAIDTRGEGRPLIVYNSLFWERTEPVTAEVCFSHPIQGLKILDSQGSEIPSQMISGQKSDDQWLYRFLFIAARVPSFGYKTYRIVESEVKPEYKTSLTIQDTVLENEFLRAVLNSQTGWVKDLLDKRNNREALAAEGNVLQAIVDEPKSMSAWQLGLKDTSWNIGERGAKVEVLERGPVRGIIRVTNVFRNSLFVQDLILYDQVPRLDCLMRLDWQERNLMIKASFPVFAQNPRADFEIPYGFISRPGDGTEVPALKWVDLTDESGNYGFSLLNDSKYGFDVRGSTVRLSIIHGATSPDPEADRGEHELLYSIVPHAGSWKEAGAYRKAYELNNPLLARVGMVHPGNLPAATSFIQVSPENVVLSAFKKEIGYDNRAMILRVYETFGRAGDVKIEFPWSVEAWETDIIERPLAKIDSGDKILNFKLEPFEVKTIKIAPKRRR